MKGYYIEDFSDEQTYFAFIHYMLEHSDYFSLLYFRYRENEKLRKIPQEIKKRLAEYQISSQRVNEWPSTITENDLGHIYQLVIYEANPEAEEQLKKARCLFEWDYPEFPMDLSFYKDGYAWFALSSHENWDALYTDDDTHVENLKNLGVKIGPARTADDSEIFYLSAKQMKSKE